MNETTRAKKRAVSGALIACVGILGWIVYRITGFIETRDSGHHGIVLSLPLLAITCGLMISMTNMEFNGRPAGPWRMVVALALFLGTMLVSVTF